MNDIERTLKFLPRIPLGFFPTPVEELKALSRTLAGPRIFMKRDDQSGLALGGNKVRKLEFLLADALQRGASTVITAGAAQSNHCRQTAAAAVRAGLKCHIVLGGKEPESPNGNLLLDHLLGATIHWTGPERRGERMTEIAEELRGKGDVPYVIPYGGSNAVGAAGFVVAMLELNDQLSASGVVVDRIMFASSSGGTQAGLAVGARACGFKGKVSGISIDKGEREDIPFETELARLCNETAERVGLREKFSGGDILVNYDYLGAGYGIVGEAEREAIRLVAEREGILLDPVYTGRAMAGVIDMIRRERIHSRETVLFWHTGGAPALFAYAQDLV